MAEERMTPPPFVDVVPDAGGWTIGSIVAVAEGTDAAASIGSGLIGSGASAFAAVDEVLRGSSGVFTTGP